jgi:hypothetical protein
VNRDNGKILPKENLEFYEFVNNKLSPKVILTIMKQRFSKSLKICKRILPFVFGSSTKNQ